MAPYPKFIEASQGALAAQGGGYRLTFAPPSSMLPGDMLIAIVATDGAPAFATVGQLVIESRSRGAAGSGCLVELVAAASGVAGSLVTDTAGNVKVQANVTGGDATPDTNWAGAAALYDTSTIVKTRSNAGGTGAITGLPYSATTANPGANLPLAITKSTAWEASLFASSGGGAGFQVFRRVVTDAEPSSYTFDSVTTSALMMGTLLVYRYVAEGALVSSSAVDVTGSTYVKPAAIGVARYTDLYLFGAYTYDDAGGVSDANIEASKWGLASKRSSHAYPTSGSSTRRLVVGEAIPKLTGGALVQQTIEILAVKPTTAFGLVVPGIPTLGAELKFSPIVPGAIGLPINGV